MQFPVSVIRFQIGTVFVCEFCIYCQVRINIRLRPDTGSDTEKMLFVICIIVIVNYIIKIDIPETLNKSISKFPFEGLGFFL